MCGNRCLKSTNLFIVAFLINSLISKFCLRSLLVVKCLPSTPTSRVRIPQFSLKMLLQKNEKEQKRGRGWPIKIILPLTMLHNTNVVPMSLLSIWSVNCKRCFLMSFLSGNRTDDPEAHHIKFLNGPSPCLFFVFSVFSNKHRYNFYNKSK